MSSPYPTGAQLSPEYVDAAAVRRITGVYQAEGNRITDRVIEVTRRYEQMFAEAVERRRAHA